MFSVDAVPQKPVPLELDRMRSSALLILQQSSSLSQYYSLTRSHFEQLSGINHVHHALYCN